MRTDSLQPALLSQGSGGRTRGISVAVVLGFALLVAPLRAMAAPPPVYTATPAHEASLRRFVNDVLGFMVLHEMGHMMVQETNQDLLGQEEYMADAFAATVLTSTNRNVGEDNPLYSVARFWDQVHLNEEANGRYNWTDIHGQSAQRAYMANCVLYASSPAYWAAFGNYLGIKKDGVDVCIEEVEKNKRAWGKVIAKTQAQSIEALSPALSPYVAVFLHKVDSALPSNARAYLSHGRQLTEQSKALDSVAGRIKELRLPRPAAIHNKAVPGANVESLQRDVQHPEKENPDLYDYSVIGDSCLNEKKDKAIKNAYWEGKSRSIVFCYALANEIEDIGKQIIARSGN